MKVSKEIVEDNQCGICVVPDNHLEIAKAVNQIMENPEWAEEMGENGKKAVSEKYNWKMEEKKLLEIYDNLLINKKNNMSGFYITNL